MQILLQIFSGVYKYKDLDFILVHRRLEGLDHGLNEQFLLFCISGHEESKILVSLFVLIRVLFRGSFKDSVIILSPFIVEIMEKSFIVEFRLHVILVSVLEVRQAGN